MKNSIKYNSVAVFCGGEVGSTGESVFKIMGGCQSSQLTFTNSIVKEKALGNRNTFFQSEYKKDSVSFPLTWIPSNFQNEEMCGLDITGQSGLYLSKYLADGFRSNLMVLVDDQSEFDIRDLNPSGMKAIFLPNTDILGYEFSASVGEIASVSAAYEADDAWLNIISGYTGHYTGITNGQLTQKPFDIFEENMNAPFTQVFIPSGISIELKDRYTQNIYDFNISAISFSYDFTRNGIGGLGSKYDYARILKAPVFGSLNMNIIDSYFSGRAYTQIPQNESGFDIKLRLSGTPIGENVTGSPQNFEINFKNALIKTDSTPFVIGGRSSNNLVFDIEDYEF